MITGDKPETALAISKMCSLVTEQHHVEQIIGLRGEPLRRRLADVEEVVKKAKLSQKNLEENEKHESLQNKPSEESLSSSETVLTASKEFKSSIASSAASTDLLILPKNLALLVDGISLETIWSSPESTLRFTQISRIVPTVVACRVSPLQKVPLLLLSPPSPLFLLPN
jgi:magnesium-transporting ATPase (P-type)